MSLSNFILAFVAGGIICVFAELLIDLTKLTPARILVTYVCFGVLLYAIGVFEPMKEIFGAGVTVPLIGFGANIAKGVKEAIDSLGPIGILSGGLSAAATGTTAALLFGLLASFLFNPRSKRM